MTSGSDAEQRIRELAKYFKYWWGNPGFDLEEALRVLWHEATEAERERVLGILRLQRDSFEGVEKRTLGDAIAMIHESEP